VRRMLTHTTGRPDDERDALGCPRVADEPVRLSALLEQRNQLRPLLSAEPRRRPGRWLSVSRLRATCTSALEPLADCSLSHASRDGDLLA
jgi:hypothetical protein